MARLIFAHSASLRAGGSEIGAHLLTGHAEPAESLRSFVRTMTEAPPASLAYEMSRDDPSSTEPSPEPLRWWPQGSTRRSGTTAVS